MAACTIHRLLEYNPKVSPPLHPRRAVPLIHPRVPTLVGAVPLLCARAQENAFKRNRLTPLEVNAIVVDEARHVSAPPRVSPATCHPCRRVSRQPSPPPRVTPATCHRRRCSISPSHLGCSTPSHLAASCCSSATPTSERPRVTHVSPPSTCHPTCHPRPRVTCVLTRSPTWQAPICRPGLGPRRFTQIAESATYRPRPDLQVILLK